MSASLNAPPRGTRPRAQHPRTQLACADATQPIPIVEDDPLGADVLAHLDAQLASVQRLLEVVLEQGAAIRARDVHAVVRFAGLMHGELARRGQIEATRSRLLERAGALLGIPAQAVTLTRLAVLIEPARARLAAERSARLRGLLEELRREHACNRALMQIELSFLDHLMQSLALDAGVHGYDPRGNATAGASAGGRAPVHALRVLDLSA
jgi:FlgN protein